MLQILHKFIGLIIPKDISIPSFAFPSIHVIYLPKMNATSKNLTTFRLFLQHNRAYVTKPSVLPKKGLHNPSNHFQLLKVYNHLIVSCRQTGKERITKFYQCFTRTIKSRSMGPRQQTSGKLLLMSAFLAPTISFTDTPQPENKVLPIEIKKTRRPKRSYYIEVLLEIYEAIRLCLRALRLAVTFTPIIALYPITFLGEECTDLWWNLLLKAIEFSGPILIKLGQWASTRRDLFPDSCCRQFSKLQRSVKPHSWKYTKYQLRRAFGPDWRKVFVKFDNNRNPVGSGCVAQVYKVWMSTDAIPDEEILTEILSEMEDETADPFEGLHVLGFRRFLGLDDGEDDKQKKIIQEWRAHRDQKRREEKEREEQRKAENDASNESDIDVINVAENLVTELVSGEENQVEKEVSEIIENENILDEKVEHSLVEEWQEEGLDKSLPVEEAPPEDLDGLVPVAVKVLHPGINSLFRRDLKIMKACASFISTLYPPLKWLSLPQCVEEFAAVMIPQINLKLEAETMESFSENFADIPYVRFSRPVRPYVTKKVLVETYEEGEQMIDFIGTAGESKPVDLKKRLAEIGVDALLKMIFVDNLVHGDLHPGNILVQNNSAKEEGSNATSGDVLKMMMVDVGCDTFVMNVEPDPNPLRICLLDCGVVSRLKKHDLANFKAVFRQVVFGDGESVADLFLDNSEHCCKDPDAFRAEMTSLVNAAREDTISLAQVDVGVLLQQVLSILSRHQVRLESAFSSVVLAVFVLEGLGRALDPNMDILERARPVLVTGKVK